MVKIRRAVYDDIPKIMQFIDKNWKKGHILGNDRTMFEFQHVHDKEVYYILAEDDTDGKLYGTMGYIPMNYSKHPDVFTMMIKTLEGSGYEFLSDEMVDYMFEKINVRCQIGVGIKKKYAQALEVLNPGQVAKWNQYYRLNDCLEYMICKVEKKKILPLKEEEQYFLWAIKDEENLIRQLQQINLKSFMPYRDIPYILHRYLKHPIYTYQAYGLQCAEKLCGVLFTRESKVSKAKCLHIVDYYGEDKELTHIGVLLDGLMKKKQYEYVDFCNYGIEESLLRKAGFEVVGKDKNTIPLYFQPYEIRNVEVYVYSNQLDEIKIYKAFSDQDRPN